ncbi:hypothetical protein JCM19237_172 [Photobacterium aphoticum]|uniref:Uncharacterized protein n=1 Tax=Photobacterium aphoticum TaxID=754436 RepID=A0A090R0T5_9GAMM|nr:hypothetical protein JCM19237_172 [Photobacterium aphoticum]
MDSALSHDVITLDIPTIAMHFGDTLFSTMRDVLPIVVIILVFSWRYCVGRLPTGNGWCWALCMWCWA